MSRTAAGVELLESLEADYQEARETLLRLKRQYHEEKSVSGVDAAAASHPVYGTAGAERNNFERAECAFRILNYCVRGMSAKTRRCDADAEKHKKQ